MQCALLVSVAGFLATSIHSFAVYSDYSINLPTQGFETLPSLCACRNRCFSMKNCTALTGKENGEAYECRFYLDLDPFSYLVSDSNKITICFLCNETAVIEASENITPKISNPSATTSSSLISSLTSSITTSLNNDPTSTSPTTLTSNAQETYSSTATTTTFSKSTSTDTTPVITTSTTYAPTSFDTTLAALISSVTPSTSTDTTPATKIPNTTPSALSKKAQTTIQSTTPTFTDITPSTSPVSTTLSTTLTSTPESTTITSTLSSTTTTEESVKYEYYLSSSESNDPTMLILACFSGGGSVAVITSENELKKLESQILPDLVGNVWLGIYYSSGKLYTGTKDITETNIGSNHYSIGDFGDPKKCTFLKEKSGISYFEATECPSQNDHPIVCQRSA